MFIIPIMLRYSFSSVSFPDKPTLTLVLLVSYYFIAPAFAITLGHFTSEFWLLKSDVSVLLATHQLIISRSFQLIVQTATQQYLLSTRHLSMWVSDQFPAILQFSFSIFLFVFNKLGCFQSIWQKNFTFCAFHPSLGIYCLCESDLSSFICALCSFNNSYPLS